MPLQPGTRLGIYEIAGSLGAGGMGEVYRARDAKVSRDVAIKVLPPLFASDPDRLARFEREAQTLGSLNHPNIAQIYGVLEDPPALVMELVDGQDLSDVIAAGPIPVPEALAIARQVADALTAAHEQGIVHRDLKPANIKVRADGAVKVLDFGLAKAMAPEGAIAAAEAMNSPTLTMRATQMGMVIGTAAYMAPEQARGKPVDRRADVWAFGVVLYEMLTGGHAFKGDGISEVLASVLKDPVPLETLPADTPAAVRRLLRRCLEKDRTKRLDSMAAARLEMDEAGTADDAVASAYMRKNGTSRTLRAAPWILTASLAVAIASWAVVTRPWIRPAAPIALRMAIDPGADATIAPDLMPEIALSRDGSTIAFAARTKGSTRTRLYVRRLDQLAATVLEGTDDGLSPFFSPDGRWIAFFSYGKLCKIPVTGGAVTALADAGIPRGGAWGDDDVITFSPKALIHTPMLRVPAGGGATSPLGPMAPGHVTQRWPQTVPGARLIFYTGHTTIDTFEDACLVVQSLDGGQPRIVQCGGSSWRYVPGYVLYTRAGTLYAAPFDLTALKVTGPAVPLVQQVRTSALSGAGQFSVGANGVLAYLPGGSTSVNFKLEVFDRAGRSTPLPGVPAGWQSVAISPDGRQLAMDVMGQNGGIWLYDLQRDSASRLSFEPNDAGPVWTPDGKHVSYASPVGGPPQLTWKAADGSGEPERLVRSELVQFPSAWFPDGRTLLVVQTKGVSDFDIWLLPFDGPPGGPLKPGTPRPFLATPATEIFATVSPDGKWIAYASSESGTLEVYVRAASPGTGGKRQVSTDGGVWSGWSASKKELVYGTADGRIMILKYAAGASFEPSRPELFTPQHFEVRSASGMPFALHPDGAHVIMSPAQPSSPVERIVLVTNFFDEIRAKVAK